MIGRRSVKQMEGSCVMWTISGFIDEIATDFDRQCEVAAGLGLSKVELRSAWGINVLDLDDVQLLRVKRILETYGLTLSSVGSPLGKVNIDADFDAHFERAKRAIEVARHFDSEYIRVFSFFVSTPGGLPGDRSAVVDQMGQLARLAEDAGVVLLHENEKGIYGDTPDRCRDIILSVASPFLKAVWDPANFVQIGVKPFTDGYSMLKPYIEYVHVKDALLSTGEVVAAGEGDGEIQDTLLALYQDGFDGYFSLEPHLTDSSVYGGFSGPDSFQYALRKFLAILGDLGIEYV